MLICASHIPDLNRLLDGNSVDQLDRLRGASVSLTAAMFLGLAHQRVMRAGREQVAAKLRNLGLPGVNAMIERLSRPNGITADPFDAPAWEVFRIGSWADLHSDEWTFFCDRFRRSASNGRKSDMFRKVGGILGEMGDNVGWHAFEARDKPCPAIAGFHVTPQTASFCVADGGQGFLRSLKRSDAWRDLASDQEALEAVVNRQATSRAREAEGGGFKQLFNALLDFNGLVVLRSGTCGFTLRNDGPVRKLSARNSVAVVGSDITVVIAPAGTPQEEGLPESA